MGDDEEPDGEPGKRKARPVVVQEGPIFLSTQAVRGSEILPQARNNLVRRVRGGSLANAPTSKTLFLSNTHGTEAGLSGITSKDCLKDDNDGDKPGSTTYTFYARDCQDVGLRPDRPPSHLASPHSERILDLDKLPLDEKDIPDIESC